MAKKMLIDATHPEETRVVVVDGNKVDEFDFESSSKRQLAGNIYLAKVTRVEPSLQAAFVEYGGNRHGFLAFSEIHPDYYQIPKADREALLAEEAAASRAAQARDDAAAGDAPAGDEDEDEAQEAGAAGDEDGSRKRRGRARRGGRRRRREEGGSDDAAGGGEAAGQATGDASAEAAEAAAPAGDEAPAPQGGAQAEDAANAADAQPEGGEAPAAKADAQTANAEKEADAPADAAAAAPEGDELPAAPQTAPADAPAEDVAAARTADAADEAPISPRQPAETAPADAPAGEGAADEAADGADDAKDDSGEGPRSIAESAGADKDETIHEDYAPAEAAGARAPDAAAGAEDQAAPPVAAAGEAGEDGAPAPETPLTETPAADAAAQAPDAVTVKAGDAPADERNETTTDAAAESPSDAGRPDAADAPETDAEGSETPDSGAAAAETPQDDDAEGGAAQAETDPARSGEAEADEADDAPARPRSRRRRPARGRGRAQPDAPSDEDAQPEAEAEAEPEVEEIAPEDPIEEARPQRPRMRRYKIQEVIKVRQIMLVQVVKEERGNKGAALTTYLSLAGRYCVLMPNTARGGGISRKITNAADRKKLKEIAAELQVPKGMGLIIRTAGAKRTRAEIRRDYEYLLRQWEQIRELTLRSIAPTLVYEEGSLIKRAIRDLYSRDIDEILVEGEEGYREAKDYMKMLMPSHARNVKRYEDRVPLFIRYKVEDELASMFNPVVQLKSGGYIVIGVTEALVAIDINSGRSTKEASIEETALKTNLEAADEIARQLRLRDLAGLIVIDFIDMDDPRNNRAVEKRMKERLKSDRARIQVGRISPFGLMEMSRQRLRPGMLEASTAPCPHCHGTGVTRSDESMALSILREVEEEGVRGKAPEILVKAPLSVVNFLMNQKREHLMRIEARYDISVRVEADPTMIVPDRKIERIKTPLRERARVQAPAAVTAAAVYAASPDLAGAVEDAEIVAPGAEAPEAPTAPAPAPEAEGAEAKPRRGRRGGRRRRKSASAETSDQGAPVQAPAQADAQQRADAGAEAALGFGPEGPNIAARAPRPTSPRRAAAAAGASPAAKASPRPRRRPKPGPRPKPKPGPEQRPRRPPRMRVSPRPGRRLAPRPEPKPERPRLGPGSMPPQVGRPTPPRRRNPKRTRPWRRQKRRRRPRPRPRALLRRSNRRPATGPRPPPRPRPRTKPRRTHRRRGRPKPSPKPRPKP
ncbi:Rne/Rng family ribonuclease [Oceanicella actignis]|uniref:Rne/Rng family ribonuclease n=1 Tax=Oceanicella actignis TaxID=1189325 RepID=UPI001252655A|nr:ribonuclease E/G [Oceanicella actignis]TYO88504.1 RNAse E [Oceanicella actignis]